MAAGGLGGSAGEHMRVSHLFLVACSETVSPLLMQHLHGARRSLSYMQAAVAWWESK